MASSLYRRESRVERANAQLISKTQAATIALDLIRREGVEAVTIRRLAEELDVKSASLYYHFRNKDDILSMAARVALRGTPTGLGRTGYSTTPSGYGKPSSPIPTSSRP
jgi:AcrR family transcriptional regulator